MQAGLAEQGSALPKLFCSHVAILDANAPSRYRKLVSEMRKLVDFASAQ